MNYSNMIITEDTTSRYQAWEGYREELTEYIDNVLEGHCPKDSWVAIWGAGGCNDIDIRQLSKKYKLLLIDQNVDQLVEVRERLGISPEVCKAADVAFWNITDDDYEMFQALLLDGASREEFESYFSDLVHNMTPPINLEKYSVACSVVVGLTSQLNARFAALLHLYKDKISHIQMERLIEILNNMNKLATEKLFISVRQITDKLIVTGYEILSCLSQEEALEEKHKLMQCFEQGLDGGNYLTSKVEECIKIGGNEYWHGLLYKAVLMDKLEEIGMCQIFNWSFLDNKHYPMLVLALAIPA